jgi:Ca2+-binding EF-hand superfamily protein
MIADTDQSGSVSPDELKGIFDLVGLQLSEREYADVLKEFDPDSSGRSLFNSIIVYMYTL